MRSLLMSPWLLCPAYALQMEEAKKREQRQAEEAARWVGGAGVGRLWAKLLMDRRGGRGQAVDAVSSRRARPHLPAAGASQHRIKLVTSCVACLFFRPQA